MDQEVLSTMEKIARVRIILGIVRETSDNMQKLNMQIHERRRAGSQDLQELNDQIKEEATRLVNMAQQLDDLYPTVTYL